MKIQGRGTVRRDVPRLEKKSPRQAAARQQTPKQLEKAYNKYFVQTTTSDGPDQQLITLLDPTELVYTESEASGSMY